MGVCGRACAARHLGVVAAALQELLPPQQGLLRRQQTTTTVQSLSLFRSPNLKKSPMSNPNLPSHFTWLRGVAGAMAAVSSPDPNSIFSRRCSNVKFSSNSDFRPDPGNCSSTPGEEVVIALGGNIGDRVANIEEGLLLMRQVGISIERHGCLYESAPAYVVDQPFFLNSAVQARTQLPPIELLHALKRIEAQLGRDFNGIRNGPRPLDLDIIFYGNQSVQTEELQVPHPRMMERPFVLAPVADLLGANGDKPNHWSTHDAAKGGVCRSWHEMGGETLVDGRDLRRVIPLGNEIKLEKKVRKTWPFQQRRTQVMGILNVTPDSFSDGGKFYSSDSALQQARLMAREGADFIDVGGQSTRPGAIRLSTEEELERALPVVEAIANDPELHDVFVSIDTFDSKVARAAVAAGAHLVNDVSGGAMDPEMYSTVAELGVPYIAMHMRGDPKSMQSRDNLEYDDVLKEVADELVDNLEKAQRAGIPAWRVVCDPGIGFSKTLDQNVRILRELPLFRQHMADRNAALGYMPLLVGPSRKGFLGKLISCDTSVGNSCKKRSPEDRDFATCAAASAAVAGGAEIIRAHNVRAIRDACRVADAVWNSHMQRD